MNKLSRELNVGLSTIESLLNALGYKEQYFTSNSKILDDIAIVLRSIISEEDNDFLKIIEFAVNAGIYDNQYDSNSKVKIVGSINLSKYYGRNDDYDYQNKYSTLPPLQYSERQNFWIDEFVVLTPQKNVNYITLSMSNETEGFPLYSVLIGTNGVGKSSLMKEIVEFFIDLHACVNESNSKKSICK